MFLSDYAAWLMGCGATCARIEKNIRRMSEAFGMESDMAVMPAHIHLSVWDKEHTESYSNIKRIHRCGISFNINTRLSKLSWDVADGRADFDKACAELEEISRFPNHLICSGGRFYWDIYELFRNVLEGLKKAAGRDGCEICSIGVDTWGVDFVCVGGDGAFMRLPRAYRDPFTSGAAERFFSVVPRDEVYRRTGIQVMDFNTLFQLHAMRL